VTAGYVEITRFSKQRSVTNFLLNKYTE